MPLTLRARTMVALLVGGLSVGCGKSPEAPAEPPLQPASGPEKPSRPPPDDPGGLTPPAEPPGARAPMATPTASDVAPAPGRAQGTQKPAAESCVKECLARNQMRAEPVEKIESDCRNECR